MDSEHDLKPGDLRGELIKHAKDPQAIMRMLDTAEKETESEFEKQVLFRLRQTGYSVHPQWKVGGYRIDMVIESGSKRVALECDGDKWHTPARLYNTSLTTQECWDILINQAVPKLGVQRVCQYLKWFIEEKSRIKQKDFSRAISIWQMDLNRLYQHMMSRSVRQPG